MRMRGYDQDEVDDFLDEIIRDYERMVQLIESMSKTKATATTEATASSDHRTQTKFEHQTTATKRVALHETDPEENETKVFDIPSFMTADKSRKKGLEEKEQITVSKDELTMLKVRLANLERKVFGKSRHE